MPTKASPECYFRSSMLSGSATAQKILKRSPRIHRLIFVEPIASFHLFLSTSKLPLYRLRFPFRI
jgi:hypothetical protein